ncbi:uncharacterized protein [Rutidosis leptorrhynchoides]|uniref:uncharacterized protein n=1 Tax=Rutidosis leptorrhynchoides TaxID=125765 RepID=UPI003A9A3A4C
MGEHLKTQDKLRAWEIQTGIPLLCPLYNGCMDSHDHLFFACTYSAKVWMRVVSLTGLSLPCNQRGVRSMLLPCAAHNIVRVVVAKLCFAAVIYFIWQERNNRMFKKSHRTEVKLFEDIFSTVRLKLLSLRFKNSGYVDSMKQTWQI